MDLQNLRAQFPALKDKTFLDSACVSLAPESAVQAIEKFLEMALLCREPSATLHHIAMDNLRLAARQEMARLVHAAEGEMALVESTTHGLNIAAGAIPLERGDRVLLSELEFMEVAIPWCHLRESAGIEIDVAPHRGGQILVEEFAARITPRTKVVAISTVQWSNGFRVDLDPLSKLCRDARIWLVVDAVQQLGAIPLDVRETPVDFLVCGGHKWLNAPFGMGFLYLASAAMPRLRRPMAGYLSLETPDGGWGNYFQTPSITPVRDYRFAKEARSFEIGGTSNYPGAAGLAASVKLLNDAGPEQIAERIFDLTDYLISGLSRIGLKVVTPTPRKNRSGIVTFTLETLERNLAMMEYLLEHKVLVSVRYTSQVGGVRISCHCFNSRDDIDRLLEVSSAFLRGRRGVVAT